MHGIFRTYPFRFARPILGTLLIAVLTVGGCTDRLLPPTAPPQDSTDSPTEPMIFYSMISGSGYATYRIPAVGGEATPVLNGQIVAPPEGSTVLYLSGDSLAVWDTTTKTSRFIDWFGNGSQLLVADFSHGRVAYSTYSTIGTYMLTVVDLDGSTVFSSSISDPFSGTLPENYTLVFLAFSPDGEKLAYFDLNPLSSYGYAPTILSISTGATTQTPGLISPILWPTGLAWSPSGDSLVISAADGISPSGGVQSSLYIVGITDMSFTPLLSTTGTNGIAYYAPIWSPDGTQIAFMLGDTTLDLWKIDLRDRSTLQLTSPSEVIGTYPQWSPGGQYILYTDNYGRLRLIDMATSTPHIRTRVFNTSVGFWSR